MSISDPVSQRRLLFLQTDPWRLRPVTGQREWFHSLKVKDREEAKRLVALETVRTDHLLKAASKTLEDSRRLPTPPN